MFVVTGRLVLRTFICTGSVGVLSLPLSSINMAARIAYPPPPHIPCEARPCHHASFVLPNFSISEYCA